MSVIKIILKQQLIKKIGVVVITYRVVIDGDEDGTIVEMLVCLTCCIYKPDIAYTVDTVIP